MSDITLRDNADNTKHLYPAATKIGSGKTGLQRMIHVNSSNTELTATTPTLYAVTLTNANTEYSQALPANCKRFAFQCRTAADVRYAFATGKVAGSTDPYGTLSAGDSYDSGSVCATGVTLYLASGTAGVVVELEVWT